MQNKKRKTRKQLMDCTTSKLYNRIVLFAEIKRRREAAGITQAEAARLAGWKSQQHWRNVESGRSPNPRVMTLFAVAKVLGCRVRDLLND
jgi:transcriptional regulator with XRE-family HTH domain